jgi:maleate isomerase
MTTNRLGNRHVFGVLVPDFNSVVEPELAALQVPGVTNQTARFALDATVLDNVAIAAERLMVCGVESWVIGLATESFPGGLALLDSGIKLLRERTGLPVYSPTYGVLSALEALEAKSLGIVTPFDDAANGNVRVVYEEFGFEVASIVGLNRPGFDEIASTTDIETQQAFKSAACEGVDALVQVGTGLPMLHQVQALEDQHGVPVVASNAAAYWQALRASGIDETRSNAGALFAEH